MKYLIIIFLFISCTKSNPVILSFRVQEGEDTAVYNAAMFCNPSDWKQIDTIQQSYNSYPDYIQHLVFKSREDIGNGLYHRKYYKILNQIK